MCGLTGFMVSPGRLSDPMHTLATMADTLRHRGPDDGGTWFDGESGVGLAHRRLAILDTSSAGHQPMFGQRYVMVFNGEIYNHMELRASLPERAWQGHSDSETLVAAFETWGVAATLRRTIGMFAIALWDRIDRNLTLARDRLGEKPLFYGWQEGCFLFASELKALCAHPSFQREIDRDALASFLRFNAVPGPYSIYHGIRKLPPGTWLTVRPGSRDAVPQAYWSVVEAAIQGQRSPFRGSDEEAIEALDVRLRQAVAGQMVADVPLGAFLSGGVDSSTVVALMQAQSMRPIRTFTIGFQEDAWDEAVHARAVAAHIGSEHTDLYVTPEQALAVIPRLPALYDEPFADSSQIPTFLLSELTRRHVTVSLSGDGGDELFFGYTRYYWAQKVWRRLAGMPMAVRAPMAWVLTALPPSAWNRVFTLFSRLLPPRWRYANPGDKLHKLADVMSVRTADELYLDLLSMWKHPDGVVSGAAEPATVMTEAKLCPDVGDFERRMMVLDQLAYLPDDILVKVDRAAMGVSLETRVPLLDHRVVEFAWSLPQTMKIRDGQSKWLLRQVLHRYVPPTLVERPKMGFGIPLDVWLRGPLREWAESLIGEARLKQEGYLQPGPIRQKWNEHLSGRRNWSYQLWHVLMFQSWLEYQKGGGA